MVARQESGFVAAHALCDEGIESLRKRDCWKAIQIFRRSMTVLTAGESTQECNFNDLANEQDEFVLKSMPLQDESVLDKDLFPCFLRPLRLNLHHALSYDHETAKYFLACIATYNLALAYHMMKRYAMAHRLYGLAYNAFSNLKSETTTQLAFLACLNNVVNIYVELFEWTPAMLSFEELCIRFDNLFSNISEEDYLFFFVNLFCTPPLHCIPAPAA